MNTFWSIAFFFRSVPLLDRYIWLLSPPTFFKIQFRFSFTWPSKGLDLLSSPCSWQFVKSFPLFFPQSTSLIRSLPRVSSAYYLYSVQFSSIFTANIEKEEHLNDDTYYFIVYITHVSKITFADFILKMKYNIIINIYITNWIGVCTVQVMN
jgi:hypothetical protein